MTVEEYFGYSREQIQSAIDFALGKGWNPPRLHRELTVAVDDVRVGDEIRLPGDLKFQILANVKASEPWMHLVFNGGVRISIGDREFVTLRLPL